jgi:hypothetical protein
MTAIEVGANIGELMHKAQVEAGHELVVRKPPEEPKRSLSTTLRVVGIELLPERDGTITLDAELEHVGRVLIAHSNSNSETDFPAFLSGITQRMLRFNKFGIDRRTGKLSRGSMVVEPRGVYTCPACGSSKAYTVSEAAVARRKDDAYQPRCVNPACTARAVTRWELTPFPALGADEELPKRMYAALQSACAGEYNTQYLIPRVWGVYPEGKAPTEWVPAAGDIKALAIMARIKTRRWEIRPFTHAIAAQSMQIHGLLAETTTDAAGLPGVAVGMLEQSVIDGQSTREYGHLIRFVPPTKQNNIKRRVMRAALTPV